MNSDGVHSYVGASTCARELAKRRISPTAQSPMTPATPIAPTTPMLAAHMFTEGNIMEDLQLAAELGKTLLERNRELESTIRNLQSVVDDQSLQKEALSKKFAALREANDARMKIYERLDDSIQEQEKMNQRLTAESNFDKKKIASLNDIVEQLEIKCEDLQKSLEEARMAQQRGRKTTKTAVLIEENLVRRSMSCENNSQVSEDILAECAELQYKYENSLTKIKSLQEENLAEIRKREELEIDLSCLSQENSVLQEQLMILKEKSVSYKSFDDELSSLNDTSTSSMICKKCLAAVDETGSNHTMLDFADDFDELDASYDSIQGDCALVKLKNGGYAWGSQESLASMGQVVNCFGSNSTSPRSEVQEPPPNSLFSELDTQIKSLVEMGVRQNREEHERQQINLDYNHGSECPQRRIQPCVNDMSGPPLNLVMTEITRNPNVSLQCQRCALCTCGFKYTDSRPKSNMEEFSEVETASSGFSEGESRLSCKFTQTESDESCPSDEVLTPTPFTSIKCLDLYSPLNPCERRFQSMPIYKQLFQEIFEVLKKSVDENEAKMAFTRSIMQSHQLVNMTTMAQHVETFTNTFSRAPSTEPEPTDEDKETPKDGERYQEETTLEHEEERNIKDTKLVRPDSLDLGDPSKSSSSQGRKRRHRPRHSSPVGADQKDKVSRVVTKTSDKKITADKESQKPSADLITKNPTSSSTVRSASDAVNRPSVEYKKSNENGTQIATGRCEHKSRSRKNKKSRNPPQLVNKHLGNVTGQKSPRPSQQPGTSLSTEAASKAPTVTKINHPSVEVAKLRRLEMSYAEVLKKRPSRGQLDRRCY